MGEQKKPGKNATVPGILEFETASWKTASSANPAVWYRSQPHWQEKKKNGTWCISYC
jgi:hypothetical protein